MILMGLGVLFGLFVWHKINTAQREIEQLFKTKQALEAKVKQQSVEIQTQKAEIKNAQIKRKNDDEVKRSNAPSIDQRLHESGWFRAEDHDNGLSSVRADLSESRGHARDEASDSGSQSDTSGDL